MLQAVNACLCAISFMNHSCEVPDSLGNVVRRPSLAQQEVQRHVLSRCSRHLERMDVLWRTKGSSSTLGGFEHTYELGGQQTHSVLVAAAVDVPTSAGVCDPMRYVSSELKNIITIRHLLRPIVLQGLLQAPAANTWR